MTSMTIDELDERRAQVGELSEGEMFWLLRRRNKFSQQRIAEQAGVTQAYLSAWESGRWSPPDRRRRLFWEALDRLLAGS